MKKLSFYFALVIVFSLSFGFINGTDEKESKNKSACPYFQSQISTDCPYLNGKVEGSSPHNQKDDKSTTECPYLNNDMDNKTGCPYKEGQKNENSNNNLTKGNWKEISS